MNLFVKYQTTTRSGFMNRDVVTVTTTLIGVKEMFNYVHITH